MANITLKELRDTFDKLCNYLDKAGIKQFDPAQDMYWHVNKDAYYNPYISPTDKDFTIGQLSFDIDEIKALISNKVQPHPYHFIWLAAILRAIGDDIVKQESHKKK